MDWKYVLRKSTAWSIIVLAGREIGKAIPIELTLYIIAIFVTVTIITLCLWALNAIIT